MNPFIPRKTAILVAAGILALCGAAIGLEPPEEKLWKGDAPGSEGVENTERTEDNRIYDVSVPTLTYYPAPKDKASGTALLICPGGAYRRLAIHHEGYDVAKWANSLGMAGAVLKYRCGKQIKSDEDIERLSVADGKRAIRLLRSRAKELGIRPDRIGIIGFSAGADLISRLIALPDEPDPQSEDPIERVSSRPDLAAIVYGSSPTLNEKTISPKTPPIFMIHAANDPIPGGVVRSCSWISRRPASPSSCTYSPPGGTGSGWATAEAR